MTISRNGALRLKGLAVLAGAALLFCRPAYAGDDSLNPQPLPPHEGDNWYVSASGTLSFLNDTSGTIANAPTPGQTVRLENSLKTGTGGQIAIGRSFGRLRLEGEVGYTFNTQNHYVAVVPQTGRIQADVDDDSTRVMINGYYDFPGKSIKPYLGAGIGETRIKIDFVAPRAPFPAEAPRQLIKDSDMRFAYQLIAGVGVPVSDRVALTLQYRWFDAGTITAHDVRGEEITRKHKGGNIDAGVRIRF